jgi:hypothetical protein
VSFENFLGEPESGAVRQAVSGEQQVIISSLTELETEVQFRARWLSGAITKGVTMRTVASWPCFPELPHSNSTN